MKAVSSSPNVNRFAKPALILGSILGSVLLWQNFSSPPTALSNQPPGPPMGVPVTFGKVVSADTVDSTDFLAQFANKQSNMIKSQVKGRISQVFVLDGDSVRAGQPLFQIDPSQQAATTASLEAMVQSTHKELEVTRQTIKSLEADKTTTETELAFNTNQLKRYEVLKTTDSVSQKDLEQYDTTVKGLAQKVKSIDANLAIQKARLQQIELNIQRDQKSAESARVNLGFYTIRAPFSGNVGEVIAKIGEVVDETTLLTTLSNNQTLEVDAAIPNDYRGKLKVGNRLQLVSYEGDPLGEANIYFISPKLDAFSQTILVKAHVPNTQATFISDQKLKARLIWGNSKSLLIPTSAVNRLAGQPFVYLAKENPKGGGLQAKMVPVTLGDIIGEQYQVTQGLTANQTIITGGIQKLQDGVPVSEIKDPKK